MWLPDLTLQPSWGLITIQLILHVCAAVALLMLPIGFWFLLPMLLLSMMLSIAKHGIFRLDNSVVKVWLTDRGWYLLLRNQRKLGPLTLAADSRLGNLCIRLSLRQKPGLPRHILLTRGMIGSEQFRRLQVFLRWSENVQFAPAISERAASQD